MGLMNSALQIGRTALLSYQGALETVGSNISGAASPDYTRLSPQLDPLQGPPIVGNLQPGGGVALTGIQRNIDEALEARLRTAIGEGSSAVVQRDSLSQVESFLDDFSGTGVEAKLRDFFANFDSLQNTPEDVAVRDLVLNAGVQLTESLRDTRSRFAALGEDLDSQISNVVATADDIARKIGRLNEEITTAESGGRGQATGLRDQRDGMLRQLGELFDVTVREQPDGAINVYIGSEALVQANFVRGLVTEQSLDGDFVRTNVRFADTTGQVDIRGGRLEGLIISRDRYGYGQVSMIDELARGIMAEVNKVHADGQGLIGLTSVTAQNQLAASDAALDSTAAGLVPPPTNGSFYITVSDVATSTPVAFRVDLSFDDPAIVTTLESLVTDINENVQGVTASIGAGNRLTLSADEGFTFTFGNDGQLAREDTSGALAALGVNTFFTGTAANDLTVSADLIANPKLLAAASANYVGDGTNASRIASIETTTSALLRGATIRDFYGSIVNGVAVASAAAQDNSEATGVILSSLQTQRESVSGVNLDEEAISLLKFERGFQAVSRFVSVVDQLMDELVALIR